MAARICLVCMMVLAAGAVMGERFNPDTADHITMTILGKERVFYRFQNTDYMLVPLAELETMDPNFVRRNPRICIQGKVVTIQDGTIELFSVRERIEYPSDLEAATQKYIKGDNLWIFAAVQVREPGPQLRITAGKVYDLETDEEAFFRMKSALPAGDADALIALGMQAVQAGKGSGNPEVWTRVGRGAVMEGLGLKKGRMTTAAEYIGLAEEIMRLLGDRALAAGIVTEAWKKNKENTELNNYLKNVLHYALYNDTEWLPVGERYEKEFWDRFNAIGYTEDQKAWELKRWVELNAGRLEDAEEKVFLCAQRTYEINPARPDAAAYLGRPVAAITGLTSGEGVTIPRKPVIIPVGEKGRLEFALDSMWIMVEGGGTESVAARFRVGGADDTEITVRFVEAGASLEEVKDRFLPTVRELKAFRDQGTEQTPLNGGDCYRCLYTYEQDGQVISNEAILIHVPGNFPGVAVVFRTPQGSFATYAEEFGKVRASLKLAL